MSSVRELGLEVVKFSGGHELLLCPFHPDRTPSAWFNPRKGLFYCSVCNLGLNMEQLAHRLGVEWEAEEERGQELEDYSMFDTGEEVVSYPFEYHPYIKQRGISEATAHIYSLRYKPSKEEAIVMPVTDLKGRMNGAIHRLIEPGGQRYLKMGHMTPLWPMHILGGDVPPKLLIVTEGGWSAMRLAPYIGWNEEVLSLMGAKANDKIVDSIRGFDNVVFLYDEDAAGITACRKMRKLAPFCNSFTLAKAPDDMNEDELFNLIGKVRNLCSVS